MYIHMSGPDWPGVHDMSIAPPPSLAALRSLPTEFCRRFHACRWVPSRNRWKRCLSNDAPFGASTGSGRSCPRAVAGEWSLGSDLWEITPDSRHLSDPSIHPISIPHPPASCGLTNLERNERPDRVCTRHCAIQYSAHCSSSCTVSSNG